MLSAAIIGDAILKAANATFNSSAGGYVVDCNATYPPFTLTIHGHQYNLTSNVLTMDVGLDGNQCLFGLWSVKDFSKNYGLDWILGDPIIRAYCHTYDLGKGQLGLALPIKH